MRLLTQILLLLPVLLFVNLTIAAEPPNKKPLIIAVHPFLPPNEIIERFTPLADYIAQGIGKPVIVRVGHNYNDHINAIGSDIVDIAYLGPASYVELTTKYGKKPLLVRQEINGQPYLRGEFIVRQDSSIKTLADIKGKSFVFEDPNSTMTKVPEYMLKNAGIPLNSLKNYHYMTGHNNVALAVLAGDYDAGAVKGEVFEKFAPKGLISVAKTVPVYDHLFVASAKLPPTLVDSLRRLFLSLNDSLKGKTIMSSIHPDMTKLALVKDSDYDSLRSIMSVKVSSGTH